jgi:hypothetical protein
MEPEGSVTQEYAPIGGEADFCRESAKLAFGDTSPVITNGLNVTVQVTKEAVSVPNDRIRDILVRIRIVIRILGSFHL